MSGGVDSSVSAAMLKQATPKNFKKFFGRPTPKGFRGYNVVGVFIKTWHPEFIKCNEEEERRDAMRVAAHLDIPFLTFDFENVYKKEVADYMISEYKAGRTPNPDVMCNKEVKFGAFFKKAISMGADYVATGHYAINSPLLAKEGVGGGNSRNHHLALRQAQGTPPQQGGEKMHLQKGIDPSKDQSYFLWTLKQEQLSKIIFPIGHLEKTEVRKFAKKFKLPVAEKKDSQGICFLGAVDLKDFLKHYIKEKKGDVILASGGKRSDLKNSKRSDLEEPEIIGYHLGAVFLTLGERHGFTITKKGPTDGPYYVVAKDIKKNTITVSQDKNFYPLLAKEGVGGGNLKNHHLALRQAQGTPPQQGGEKNSCLLIKNTNWISEIPKENKKYTAQIRYHGEFLSCRVEHEGPERSRRVKVIFDKPVLVDKGQSCVLYDKNVVLGGGIIS